MKTRLMGVDSIEIIKYYQLVLIATLISTFYCAVILGVGIALGLRLEVVGGREGSAVRENDAQ
jgi:hypothetical protein